MADAGRSPAEGFMADAVGDICSLDERSALSMLADGMDMLCLSGNSVSFVFFTGRGSRRRGPQDNFRNGPEAGAQNDNCHSIKLAGDTGPLREARRRGLAFGSTREVQPSGKTAQGAQRRKLAE